MNVRSIRATLIALSLCGSCGSSHADNLIGQVSVIDGDTIEMHGMRIRFWGIDAPESSQLCRDQHGNEYRCGAQAANNLDAFIAQRPVNCAPLNVDRYGRTVGVCSVAGADLGDWLARNGLALDWPRYSKGKYRAAQKQAEQAKLGIWKGSYVEPWMYRDCIGAGGRSAGCSDNGNSHPAAAR